MTHGRAADPITAIRLFAAWTERFVVADAQPELQHDDARAKAELKGQKTLAVEPFDLPSIMAAVKHVVSTTAGLQNGEAVAVLELLSQSNARLAPLSDPLCALDFSKHRWLGGHREESFSNWLQWIMSGLDAGAVLRLFNVDCEETLSLCSGKSFQVLRESTVAEGHEGHQGRLDLAFRFAEALLVVEVKLVGADEADVEKQKGYSKWLALQPFAASRKHSRLLVRKASESDYYGFQPCRWADLCIGLRREAVRLKDREELMKAAMILAFVGAVEQSLLGLRAMSRHTAPEIADHLRRYLEALDK
jgi:hypothetical protein